MAPIADRTKRARTSFEKTAMIDEFVRSGSVDTQNIPWENCVTKRLYLHRTNVPTIYRQSQKSTSTLLLQVGVTLSWRFYF